MAGAGAEPGRVLGRLTDIGWGSVLRALLAVLRLAVLRLAVLRLRLVLLARIEGLRFARCKRLAADGRRIVAIVVTVVRTVAALLAALLEIGLALAKLLLRRRDQTEVMLGVLIIIFGRDRVSGALRIASKLKIFFGDLF